MSNTDDRLRLHDRVILVSGAARGIGAACAEACARDGARVVLTDRDVDGGRAAAAEAGAAEARAEAAANVAGGRVRFIELDVREEDHWSRAVADVLATEGRLDGLVNNAGITGFSEEPPLGPGDPSAASLAAWRAVHATNLDGTFLGCRAAMAAMSSHPGRGGSIVNIGSRSGRIGVPAAAAYAASKAAVESLSWSVALWCAEQGWPIRCNTVLPGAIRTPMWESLVAGIADPFARETALAGFAADVPLRRMGRPEDVAATVVHLLSDDAAYITGASIAVDGGLTAGTIPPPKPADGAAR